MGQQSSSLATDNKRAGRSHFLITDINFERTDRIEGGGTSLSLTELWVFGIAGLEGAKSFALCKSSPGCWEATGFIEITAETDAIHCIVKSDEGDDIGFVYLDVHEMGDTIMHSEHGLPQKLVVCDAAIQLTMLWKCVEISSGRNTASDGVVAQLNERGIELLRAFERTGNLSDMTEGILMLQQAVDITPDGHASKPGLLNNLGASLTHRFERTGQLSDIVGAISVQQQAVARTPHGHAGLPGYLSNLGNSFTCRFLCTGELSDITDAISVHQQAVGLAPHGHADMHTLLTNLGSAFAYRFERTGQPSDISDAISMLQKAVDLTPQGHIDMPARLSNLGTSFTHRFQHTGELVDITNAISVQQKAMDLMPLGHPHLPALLANLGTAFARRFERTGELSDINDAISVQQEAVNLTPEGHADLPVRLNGLGNSFACRFRRTGEPSDIAEAISVHQKGVDLTPRGHAGLPARLANLGNSFTYRFQRTGELKDIADAISVQQKAVDLTPLGHADLPGYLDNLGSSFTHRFQRTGELVDIANAISAKQKAVDLTPHRHRNMPSLLTNLGSAFACRFHRTGELSDIDDAISMQQKAVDSTPQGHAGLPGYLSSLGSSFNYRFDRTGELSDITEAISVQQKAVDLTPHGHADLPARLGNLGSSFICRFEHTGRLSDVSNSISMQQKAVHLTPDGHADLPNLLTNLGSSFARRFESSGQLSDITDAISMQQKAEALTPDGHADRPGYLHNLGASFYTWFASTGHSGDLEESLSHYKAAAISTIGPPRVKLNAAKHWAHKLIQHCPQSPDVILSFDTVLGLVALIAGLEQTVRGRYTQLETTSGLALEAAAAACALGRADKALEWLEQGRCLVWSQLNNLRTPLDDLRVHNEELARDIADVSKQLENAGSSRIQSHADMQLSEKISLEDEARAHLGLARKWDDLLKRARAIPTFESFLMPSPCSALMQHVPESGPIIVINIDQRRCDALALLAGLDEPLHIPLPNFSIKKANEHRAALTSQLRTFQLRAREVEDTTAVVEEARGIRPATMKERDDGLVHHVLRSLWEEVVKPVLDGLGFSIVDGSTGTVPPRLWWCPTGPLSFLPLHAAGIYQGSDSESALDYVVSSYTPTVTAITDRVKRLQSVDGKASSGLLLTNQPNVPGASPIPGTTKEVRSIFNRAEANGVKALKLEGDEMSIAGCLERMQDFTGIHLACHGSQNAAEPLQSRFLFHQGSLELSTILKSNLKNADLAFLSACQTSTGQEKLSDEAVHLVAGMLAAGYLRVVGTMWSIGDKPAQEVATTFYEYMFTHRDEACGAGFDGTLSAVALHHATRQLHLSLSLDDSERSLLTWIPFVHFGL